MVIDMAPARLPRVWLMLAWLAAIGLAILFVDRPFAEFSHAALRRPEAAVWVTRLAAAWPMDVAALLALAVLGIRRALGLRPARLGSTILAVALAVLLATLAAVLAKWVFGRLWPETWIANNPSWITNRKFGFFPLHGGIGYESFPSGHTARVSAAAAVLWWRVPRLRALWLAVPLAVAAGLLAANFHFVSDCLAGALLGTICGWCCLAPSRRHPTAPNEQSLFASFSSEKEEKSSYM